MEVEENEVSEVENSDDSDSSPEYSDEEEEFLGTGGLFFVV